MKTFAIFILIVQLAWACQQAVAMKLTVEIKPKLDPLAESQVSPGKIVEGSSGQSYLDHHPHPSVGQFRQLVRDSLGFCSGNPCKNGGICQSGKCFCADGWTGPTCEGDKSISSTTNVHPTTLTTPVPITIDTNRDLPCIDTNPNCRNWAEKGECQANPKYMQTYCTKTCGCNHQPKTTTTTTPKTTTTTTTSTSTSTTATTTTTTTATPYRPSGPQTNVPMDTVTKGGWTQCYHDTYDAELQVSSLPTSCTKPNIMMACRRGSDKNKLVLLAWADRGTVFNERSTWDTKTSQGTDWYWWKGHGMGFSAGGTGANIGGEHLITCDQRPNPGEVRGELRLCWHMGGRGGGYRCGTDEYLDVTNKWDRLVFHAD